jgi:hypothetical protein
VSVGGDGERVEEVVIYLELNHLGEFLRDL